MAKKSWIPEISEEKLNKLCQRIKPVIRFSRKGKKLFRSSVGAPRYIKQVDPHDAFLWDPKLGKKVKGLKRLSDIFTYHTFAYASFFKPSIAEVIAQIPEDLLDKVVAFEIIGGPRTSDDLNNNPEATHAGYHVATTRLYIRKKPKK
ncbi:hypothetical protein JW977_04545 [Candidatus Falkowbacteria bacterium]|nr:hypothetical protein [Candidatus Falkowbacteria bacterium]